MAERMTDSIVHLDPTWRSSLVEQVVVGYRFVAQNVELGTVDGARCQIRVRFRENR